MKGFIAKATTVVCFTGAVAALQGCVGYRDVVDPCWPERYNYAAREEVKASFLPQINNGHILDQTLWNYHFEHNQEGIGLDVLTPDGQAHLAYLARRRPHPDTCIYLQTAQVLEAPGQGDIPYDPAHPEKFVEERAKLDSLRIAAIQRFLNTQTAGRPMTFTVAIHDPSEVGMPAIAADHAIREYDSGFRGFILGGAGGGGGASPGAGGGR